MTSRLPSWESLRRVSSATLCATAPPDFFLPLNTEPFVESDADLNKSDTHWLDLIGRIQPGATRRIHRG